MFVLDTDHLSVLEWQNTPTASMLLEKIAALPSSEVGTTIVNFEEQMRGWMSFISSAKSIKEQITGYRRLQRQLELYASVVVASFDENAATRYQRLKKESCEWEQWT